MLAHICVSPNSYLVADLAGSIRPLEILLLKRLNTKNGGKTCYKTLKRYDHDKSAMCCSYVLFILHIFPLDIIYKSPKSSLPSRLPLIVSTLNCDT